MVGNFRPVCPSCGAQIEPLRSDLHTTLSCCNCGWNIASARRVYGKELLWAGTFLVVLVVGGIHDSSASMSKWSDLILGIAIVGSATWFVVRKPWKAYRHFASSAKSTSLGSNGISAAPRAFAQLIPSRDEAEDLFSGILNVAKPRPVKWSWTQRAAMAVALLIAAIVVWIAYEALLGSREEETVGFAVLFALIFYLTIELRFPIAPAFSRLRLLRFAEVTVGRVVCLGKTMGGAHRSESVISYAFLDGAGRAFIGQGIDYTDSLMEGAPVVIFYDALDPTLNVALECSRFTIKVPK